MNGVRYGVLSTLSDLRRLANELEEADRQIAAHTIRRAVAVLDAELRRLSPAAPVVAEEDDGDPEVFGW